MPGDDKATVHRNIELSVQVETLQSELADKAGLLQRAQDSMGAIIQSYTQKLEDAQEKQSRAERERETAELQVQRLKDEIAAAGLKGAEADRQHREARETILQLHDQLQQLEAKDSAGREEAANLRLEATTARVRELEAAIAQKDDALRSASAAQGDLRRSQRDSVDWRAKAQGLEEQLQRHAGEIAMLHSKEETIRRLRADLAAGGGVSDRVWST